MKDDKLYFIKKIGTNDLVCLKDEDNPLIVDNIDDALDYVEYYNRLEQEQQTRKPKGYMTITISDFYSRYDYTLMHRC